MTDYKIETSQNVDQRQKVDNLVKKTRPISTYRDAAFMRDSEGLFTSASGAISPSPSVYNVPLTDNSPLGVETRTYPSLTDDTEGGGRSSTKYTPWWHQNALANPARSYRDPAQWRDTSPILRVHYYHRSLGELGEVHSFSLNLRDDIETEARLQREPHDWLHRRIALHLNNALGRKVDFLLVSEEAPRQRGRRRLHLHGTLQCSAEEAVKCRKALRKAGGLWKQVRQHQAHTDANPDDGWAGYICKDFWKFMPHTRKLLTGATGFTGVSIHGRICSATKNLKQRSIAAYEHDRSLVMNYRKRNRCSS